MKSSFSLNIPTNSLDVASVSHIESSDGLYRIWIIAFSEFSYESEVLRKTFDTHRARIGILETIKNILSRYGESSLCVLVETLDSVLYVGTIHDGAVYLKRNGVEVCLLDQHSPQPKVASGKLHTGDTLILGAPIGRADQEVHFVSGSLEDYSQPVDMPQLSNTSLRSRVVKLIDWGISHLPERRLIIGSDTLDLDTRSHKKKTLLVGVFLFVLLLLSMAYGTYKHRANAVVASYEKELTQAQFHTQEAKTVGSLNAIRARELLLQARAEIDSIVARGIKDNKISELQNEIVKLMADIAKVYESSSQLFLDTSLLSANFTPRKIVYSEGIVGLLDTENKKFATVVVETKKTEMVAGPEYLPDALSAAQLGERSFILSRDGVREVTDEVELLIKPEEDWRAENVLISAFAANMYVLDRSANNIWRYPGGSKTFGAKGAWIAPGMNVDIADTKTFLIDGMVWILGEDGNIQKYSQGVPQSFKLVGVQDDLYPSNIFTYDDTEHLYVKDRNKPRILVFSKTGDYQAEYNSDDLEGVDEFIVSEVTRRIIFLKDSKLHFLELKHL